MHTPVLLNEVLDFLKPEPGKFFIDGTIDGGGHSVEIFRRISPGGTLLGIDLDETMLEKSQQKISAISKSESLRLRQGFGGQAISKMFFVKGNYADLPEILEKENLPKADGLLLDLGFSSEQLESSGRGFSFKKDEPLLMTYDPSATPVREILKEIDENALADIIFEFSGERFSRKIATAIKTRGRKKSIETSGELNEIIKTVLPKSYERGRIEPATRTFQALRIYANHELENIEKVIKNLPEILKPGGRMVFISFHSLEDRMVKKSFKRMAKQGKLEILTPKPVRPTREEARENPRSRSAMLRTAALKTDN
ncbi:MAG: 16S rRNA (cytosine(1402)-N(4))-methyltransferase RsmH [Candidatus Liptonbacteria bacterium]|nr:16S rRNA (cytosine(1402)-N(4))-methyltransferase RsmH [Candidatus Liptonbacteria bacterium]